jgi:cytochrome c-type biogenesis protein
MAELLTAFSLGNQAILLNTCLLPLYPGLIAFLACNVSNDRSRRATAWLGLLVLAGILTMMLLVGLIFFVLQQATEALLPTLLPLLYGIVILFGLVMLSGRNPFVQLATTQVPILRNPYTTAYVYGLLLGPMTLPCIGPFVVSGVFVVGAGSTGRLLEGLLFFLAFGLGFGWPLVILPLIALPAQRRFLAWLTRHHLVLTRAAGVLLIAIGSFGVMTELLSRGQPSIEITDGFKVVYWLSAIALTLAVGVLTYRVKLVEEDQSIRR